MNISSLPFWVNVISTGRCGTMTLHKLYALASGVHSYHEPKPLLGKLNERWHHNQIRFVDCVERLLSLRLPIIERAIAGNCGIVEASSMNNYLTEVFKYLYNKATFIHLHRHPFLYIRSASRRNNYVATDRQQRTTPMEGSWAAEQWSTWMPVQKIAWRWNDVTCIGIRYAHLQVASRDVFRNDEKTIASLYGLVGLDMPLHERIVDELAAHHNKQVKGRFNPPAGWVDKVWKICGRTAEYLGYTKDDFDTTGLVV